MDTTERDRHVRAATGIAPVLRDHASWADEHRCLHPEAVEAMAEAGVFRLRTPARFGGAEADARTLVDVATELGAGDGSASWVASVYWIPTWMAGLFPDAVQEEVFSSPDARICGTLSPGGTARPVDGGVVVDGRWGFISGARHAQWQEIIAILAGPTVTPHPIVALVPIDDLTLVDDWDTWGLRGTGSVSTVAEDLFVPAERVLPLPQVLEGIGAGTVPSAMHGAPLLPIASVSSVGTVLGLARAARETFLGRLPGRKITYTDYESQGDAPITHHLVARAALLETQAGFHAHRLADGVDRKQDEGEPWKLDDRAWARGDLGETVRLVRESVHVLADMSGGTSVYRDVPLRRTAHDVEAVATHALMNPTTNTELLGRVLCGLEPNTLYI